MLDFLFDNPFLLIILLFWLFNAIFGKKKAKPGEEATPRTVQKESTRKERYKELLGKLEQGMDKALDSRPVQAALDAVAEPGTTVPVPPRAAAGDPYAFHSASVLEARTVPAQSERTDDDISETDYDLTAEDYDLTAEDYDTRASGFGYHSALEEPMEQEYHLNGFREFHLAHGLTESDRAGLAEAVPVNQDETSSAIAMLFTSRDELRRAFLLQEILGKPKALRPPGR